MLQHLSNKTIDDYRQRILPPAELLAANDHLVSCETCYIRFTEEAELEVAYRLAQASMGQVEGVTSGHAVYEQIAAYVDGRLDGADAMILEAHLKVCNECDIEVGELRSLQNTLSADELISNEPVTPRSRLRAPWLQPAFRLASWVAAAAAVAALIWITTIPLRSRIAGLETQVADLQQDNERLRGEHANSQLALEELKTQIAESRTSDVDHSASSSERMDIVLNDGGSTVTLDGRGNLGGVKTLPPSYEQLLENALVTQRVTRPPIVAKLRGKPGTLMGEAGGDLSFKLLSPVGVAVLTDRPNFRWGELSGASGYVISIHGPNSKEVATSPLLSSTEWTPSVPLPRGRIYAWQVRAIKDGEEIRVPSPAAADVKFQVLDRAKAIELARVTREFGNHRLLLGLLYARVGLLEESEREFTALLDANPKSRVAQRLLDSIKSIRR